MEMSREEEIELTIEAIFEEEKSYVDPEDRQRLSYILYRVKKCLLDAN